MFYFLCLLITAYSTIDCGDLLVQYAKKPAALEFIDCKKGTVQNIWTARYRVAGKDAASIEQLLKKKYGMGKLVFNCCGWECKKGKYGMINSKKLKAINSNYLMSITMTGNGEQTNENGEYYLETDRNKIPFFEITVEVLDI